MARTGQIVGQAMAGLARLEITPLQMFELTQARCELLPAMAQLFWKLFIPAQFRLAELLEEHLK